MKKSRLNARVFIAIIWGLGSLMPMSANASIIKAFTFDVSTGAPAATVGTGAVDLTFSDNGASLLDFTMNIHTDWIGAGIEYNFLFADIATQNLALDVGTGVVTGALALNAYPDADSLPSPPDPAWFILGSDCRLNACWITSAHLSFAGSSLVLGEIEYETQQQYERVLTGALSQVVVPIPATLWLFGSGLLGLIGVARRRVRS